MADIRAFRGWRYNLARVGELSAVVAPPYDVIDPSLEMELQARHPANIVRVELGKEPPAGADSDRYSRAARQLHEWKTNGTLVEDSDPAIYVCHQNFQVAGRDYTRRGFIARLRLEPFGTGSVFPHEETMPGPKADRLRLYHATGMNVSPTFGMYPDPHNEIQELCEEAVRRDTPLLARDHLGVESRLWPLTNHDVISRVRGLMGSRPVYIADGHHRYETALRYREERMGSRLDLDDESPPNFCMMMCVSMHDPGLLILPTHRLLSGIADGTADRIRSLLSAEFAVEEIGRGEAGSQGVWDLIEADGAQNVLGFGTLSDARWQFARLRGPHRMEKLVPHHSPAWRGLGVSILHELVIGELFRDAMGTVPPPFRYVHLLQEVNDALAAGECDLACLVPTPTMEDLRDIASSGERMPAKSTYFYPKLLTGLVLNPIA